MIVFLLANQAVMPYVGAKRPKTDRMLNLIGDWLFAIVNSSVNSPRVTGNGFSSNAKKNNDGVSDGQYRFEEKHILRSFFFILLISLTLHMYTYIFCVHRNCR